MAYGKSSSFDSEETMQMRILISFMFFVLPLIASSETHAAFYSAGPWRGVVLDADTKEPIEGAVVAAIWQRAYDSGFGSYRIFQEAKEALTDNTGRFEIPAYIEKRGKSFWRTQDLKGDPKAHLLYSGPTIEDPDFIIYKPSYGNFPHQGELVIYAIGPGPSTVEYQELHKKIVKGQEITWAERKTKVFPEGLVYYSNRCLPKVRALEKILPFKSGSFFIPMERAKEKIENLDVSLECPDNGDPIPGSMHGFRDDIENQHPLRKGGYIVLLLPKMKTLEERHKAIPAILGDVSTNDLPVLQKSIKQEEEYLWSRKIRRQEK
jgi:hypothetical protein